MEWGKFIAVASMGAFGAVVGKDVANDFNKGQYLSGLGKALLGAVVGVACAKAITYDEE